MTPARPTAVAYATQGRNAGSAPWRRAWKAVGQQLHSHLLRGEGKLGQPRAAQEAAEGRLRCGARGGRREAESGAEVGAGVEEVEVGVEEAGVEVKVEVAAEEKAEAEARARE